MHPSRMVTVGLLGVVAVIGVAACGSSTTPTQSTTPTSTLPAGMTETRVGTTQAHGLAWVVFQMSQPGLVSLRVDPVLLLTLRTGNCPEACGDFVANSDNGGLTFQAPAGTNSVLVGNPFDDPRSFSLQLTHPR